MQAECGFHEKELGFELLIKNGPSIQVVITFDPLLQKNIANNPTMLAQDIPEIKIHALIDTGASNNHIDTAIANSLTLPIVDQVKILGSAGVHEVDVYMGQIIIPSLKMVVVGRFAGVHLSPGGQKHGAILGRTFLRNLKMEYHGSTGRVTLIRNVEEKILEFSDE